MNAALVLGIIAGLALTFCAAMGWVLGGRVVTALDVPVRGRHRGGRRRPRRALAVPDVFDRVLASYGADATPLLALADPLPFVPGPDCRDVDDWTADLATEVITVASAVGVKVGAPWLVYDAGPAPVESKPATFDVDRPRRTSPAETAAESARRRWGVECPIFAGLADDWGFDPVHGFDGRAAA